MMLFIFIFLCFVAQEAIEYILSDVIGLNYIWVVFLVNLIFAFFFAFLQYMGNKKDAFKDKRFYKNFGRIFLFFTVLSIAEFITSLFLIGVIGLNLLWVALIIDFILSFIFALVNYPGSKKEAFRDSRFHSTVAIYFILLAGFALFDLYVL
mgnify:CR=1 FL=1